MTGEPHGWPPYLSPHLTDTDDWTAWRERRRKERKMDLSLHIPAPAAWAAVGALGATVFWFGLAWWISRTRERDQ